MTASLLEAGGITMPANGTCQMMWTGTCSRNGGQKIREAKPMSFRYLSMTSADKDNDGHEPTFQEAKDEFEFWLEHFVEYAEMDSCHFKWKYKKGREPDVLAYLILDESEQRKFRN